MGLLGTRVRQAISRMRPTIRSSSHRPSRLSRRRPCSSRRCRAHRKAWAPHPGTSRLRTSSRLVLALGTRTTCSSPCLHRCKEVVHPCHQTLHLQHERRACRTRRWRNLGLVMRRRQRLPLRINPPANRPVVERLQVRMLHRTVSPIAVRARRQRHKLQVPLRQRKLARGGRLESSWVPVLNQGRAPRAERPCWALAAATGTEVEATRITSNSP
mmetsp:Transcript_61614/g.116534  ORF Transcript_61614/g.116534 Transcript_61614/m.116534 type:complete len:214 (+) Transcript_61614:409-1050(+)